MVEKPPTHVAYALRRESRFRSRYLEIGHAESDKARCPNCNHEFPYSGVHQALLDRLPTGGGFTWHVTFSPIGVRPADPESQPERPGDVEA
jgi:hypothetical protein